MLSAPSGPTKAEKPSKSLGTSSVAWTKPSKSLGIIWVGSPSLPIATAREVVGAVEGGSGRSMTPKTAYLSMGVNFFSVSTA